MVGRIALLFFLLVAAVVPGHAQYNPFAPEAPESLLQLDIGDAEVDLTLAGSWETGIGGGTGISLYRDETGTLRSVFPSPFPGLETVPFFNRVNLTLSLWLLERYFFETTVSDEFELSSLLFGYQGRPGEFVQSILIGNTAIEMSAFPLLGFGDSTGVMGRDAPGLSGLFETERSSHELMVRLEPSEDNAISYEHGAILSEADVDSAQYIRDRFFALPDGSLDSLVIYEESASGSLTGSDGRNYRVMDLGAETVFSLADGTVSFPKPPAGRVIVSYKSAGRSVGDPALGTGSFYLLTDGVPDPNLAGDFSFEDPAELLSVYGVSVTWSSLSAAKKAQLEADYFKVTVGGDAGLVLYEPGRYSPFAISGVYMTPEGYRADATVSFTSPGNTRLALPLSASPSADGSLTTVSVPGAGPRSFSRKYPFAAPSLSEPTPRIYGPAADAATSRVRLTFQTTQEADSLVLDGDFIPGSVRVLRNGSSTTAFEVLDSGEVVFTEPLTDLDRVEVRYRTAASGESGDLLIGQGNRFSIVPGLEADVALGIRWKPIQSSYSTAVGQYPGYISLSASTTYDGAAVDEGPPVSASLTAGGSYSVSDTTGALRLAGMDGTAATVSMSPRTIFPGPPPAEDPDESDAITTAELGADTRGTLVYKDYTASTFLGGSEIQSYVWDPPSTQVYPYADGGRIGPYAAVSNDTGTQEYAGSVMVMEYSLAEDANWVAGLIRINGGRQSDLSGTTRIAGSYRATEGGDGVRLFLQIGALAEDLDADGVLDTGSSNLNPGLAFDDAASGATLQAGAVSPPPEAAYTEDADGDSRLDPELADLVVTRELAPVSTADGWRNFEIDLTTAERQALRSGRSVRLLIQRDATGGDRSGRIIFSDLSLYGTAFSIDAPAAASVTAAEIPEAAGLPDPLDESQTLAAAFPAVSGRFDAGGAVPAVLSVSWEGLGSAAATLTRAFEPVPASDYGELRLYARGLTAGVTMTLRAIEDVTGNTVAQTTVTLPQAWSEVTVPLPPDSPSLITQVAVEISGADSGEILVDELSLWNSRETFGATASLEAEWKPAVSLRAGGVTILDGLVVSPAIRARSAGYPNGLSATSTGVEATATVGARILGAPVEIGVAAASTTDGTSLRANHALSLPFSQARIVFQESFSRSYLAYGESLQHKLGVSAGPYGPASVTARWLTERGPQERRSTWDGSASLAAGNAQATSVAADIDVSASEDGNDPLASGSYPRDWAASFADIRPSVDAENDRSISAEANLRVEGDATAVELTAVASSAVAAVENRHVAVADVEAAVPLSLGDRLRLTPRITRSVRLQSENPGTASFGADVDAAGALLHDQAYLLTAWPFWELADPSLPGVVADATRDLDAARYTPEISFEVSRPVQSSPWSLVVPSGVRLSAKRNIVREDDALTDTAAIESFVTFTAPNVLGRLGSRPLFGFYDTDEFVTRVALAVDRDQGGDVGLELDVDQNTRLAWLSGERAEISSTLATGGAADESLAAWETETTVDATFTWPRPADWMSRIPRVADAAELSTMLNSESVVLAATWSGSPQITLLFKHTSGLTVADRGTISLYGGAGLGVSRSGEIPVFSTGLQIGIEGKLQF